MTIRSNDSKEFPKGRVVPQGSLELDPAGELLALTTHGRVKNIILGALELDGALDMPVLREAVSRVARELPRFTMSLKETRERLKHYLRWDNSLCLEIPFFAWDMRESHMGAKSGLEILLECLEPHLNRDRNMLREPPCEVHVIKLDGHRHVLAAVMSHVAADAMTLVEIVKELMITYHEAVTGSRPALPVFQLPASTSGKRAVRRRTTVWRDYWDTCRHAFIPYSRCSVPVGSRSLNDPGEHHVKRVLPCDESREIAERAAGMSISVVDYLLACAVQAVERWNSSRGVASSTITAALTVNMNGRFQKIGGVNNDSVLYFPCGPEQMADLSRLGKWIARSRMRQFRRHMDVKYATGMEKLNNFLRVLPFAARRQMYVRLLQRHQTSFALGFLGVLWPETNGRTMTGESYLTSAGGLEITEVHGMAYKIFSRTPLYLSAYFFRKRLNIVLSAAAWNFTKEESQDFLGLVVDLLEGP